MLKTARFSSESRTHTPTAHGSVLELVVAGAIPHELPNSAELMRSVGADMCDEIRRHRFNVVVLNLSDLEYAFGNEIAGILLPPYMALADLGGGKIAIVATGATAAGLESLIRTGHLRSLFGAVHPDLQSALAGLTTVPAREPESPIRQTMAVTERTRARRFVWSLPVDVSLSPRGLYVHVDKKSPAAATLRFIGTRARDEIHDDLFHDSFYPHEGRKCVAINLIWAFLVLGALAAVGWVFLRHF